MIVKPMLIKLMVFNFTLIIFIIGFGCCIKYSNTNAHNAFTLAVYMKIFIYICLT